MQFIKTLFWVVLAVVLVVFAANNWSPTSVLIWEDLRIDTKLPVLVIGAFLIGFLPLYLIYRTTKWRLRRRIRSLEASQAAAAMPAPTPSSVTAPTAEAVATREPLELTDDQRAAEPVRVEPVASPDTPSANRPLT